MIGWLLVVLGSTLVPGYALLTARYRTTLDQTERLAASFGASFALYGLVALTSDRLLISLPGELALWHRLMLVALTLGSIGYLWWTGARRPADEFSFPLILFGLLLLLLALLFTLTTAMPVYEGGSWNFDWFEQYQISLHFAHQPHLPVALFARTPLYNLVQAFFLTLGGASFSNYQIINLVVGGVALLSLGLLARTLFGQRVALVIAAACLVSPWFLHLTWYPWSKMLCVYYTLLALHFYLTAWTAPAAAPDRTRFLLCGVTGGLAYLAHPLALFSLLPLLLDLLWLRGPAPLRIRIGRCVRLGAYLAAIVLPWYVYVFFTNGLASALSDSPMLLAHPEQRATLLGFFIIRLHNAIFSILPSHLFILLGKLSDPFLNTFDLFKITTEIYYNSLAGCLTLTGLIAALAAVFYGVGSPRRLVDQTSSGDTSIRLAPWFGAAATGGAALTALLWGIEQWADLGPIYRFYPSQAFPYLKILTAMLSAVLCALCGMACWNARRLTIAPMHRTVLLVIAVGGLLGVLVHPDLDGHGVAHNAMTPAVVLIAIYATARLVRAGRAVRGIVLTGFLGEAIVGLWLTLYWYLDTSAFERGKNLAYKTSQQLVALADLAGPSERNASLVIAGLVWIVGATLLIRFCLWTSDVAAAQGTAERHPHQPPHGPGGT